ncbi:hypothetical protein J2W91_003527 [Paenibacillus amylolyticus]|uniref:Uncharacterized protein n=1 Tax=Paenibacillus amylolyticus TaxID=1451 RepID=A0AAP5H720_PAEAM|nr:hypothetical protein [Paenibacillus amylolyticus]MDR6725041.1 hypothetical protein [Paenibacillus amylolyticus]
MSVCNIVFLNGGEKAYISADSRVCVIRGSDPERYQLHDDAQKLQFYSGGFVAYISGSMDIADTVSSILQETGENDINKIVNLTKDVYYAYLQKRPYLKDSKYNIQVVIPGINEEGKWGIVYFDEVDNFDPVEISAHPGEDLVIGYGKGHWTTDPVIERYLGKEDIGKVLLKAYAAAANEQCGGTLTYFELDKENTQMYTAKIPDTKKLKRYKDYFPDAIKHGEGDGMTATSGKYIEKKYNGGLSQTYYQSNTGRERSVLFDDSGIVTTADRGTWTARSKDFEFISTDNGTYRLSLSNGSTFELTTSGLGIDIQGDINIKATGNIKMNGARIDLN